MFSVDQFLDQILFHSSLKLESAIGFANNLFFLLVALLILYVNPSITGLARCVCVVCVFLNKEKKTAWYREMNRITEFFTILKQNNRRFSNVSNASILCKGTVSQDFLSLFWLKSLFLGFLLKGQFDKICIYQFVSLKSELAHLSF